MISQDLRKESGLLAGEALLAIRVEIDRQPDPEPGQLTGSA